MVSSLRISFLLSSSVLILVACNGSGSGALSDTDLSSAASSSLKVYYEEATYEQVAEEVELCHGGKKLCVTICHRPPGNPTNSKNLFLPLSAANAHLNHGGDHADRDTLGACEPDDNGDNPPPTEEEDNDGGGTGGSGSGGDIPAWCLPLIAYDSNCDGFDDSSGEPLF